jgi:hypothetical protein
MKKPSRSGILGAGPETARQIPDLAGQSYDVTLGGQ